jgi:hypothetical protein
MPCRDSPAHRKLDALIGTMQVTLAKLIMTPGGLAQV